MSSYHINKTTKKSTLETLKPGLYKELQDKLQVKLQDKLQDKLQEKYQYLKDVYDVKFLSVRNILKQPTKKHELLIKSELKEFVVGSLFVVQEYQNLYSVYGKIEILKPMKMEPEFQFPINLRAKHPIIIQGICYEIGSIEIKFVNTIINNDLFIIMCKANTQHLKPNQKIVLEFNSIISLPGPFPIHVGL